MKKILLIALFVSAISFTGFSQDYSWGVGVRGGYYNGLTIKHFISEGDAIEGIFSSRWHGFEVTGLYEVHKPLSNGFCWFFGGGAHVGFYDNQYTKWANSGMTIGIDGIIGLEYKFANAPFTIGIDYKPSFDLIGHTGLGYDGGGLSIRYVF